MKRVILTILLLIAVIACVPEPTPAPVIQAPSIGEPKVISEVPNDPVESKEEKANEVILEPASDVAEFIAKAEKVKQYSYHVPNSKLYFDLENNQRYIETTSQLKINGKNYDRVFIDDRTGAVYAWCIKQGCDIKYKDTADRIKYQTHFDYFTPIKFLQEKKVLSIDKEKTRIFKKQTSYFATLSDGNAWLHSFYALPLQYEVEGESIEFLDLVINPALWKPLGVPEHYTINEG